MSTHDQRTDVAGGRLSVRLATALTAVVLTCAGTAASAQASTSYQQDAGHSGYSPQSLGTLTQRWEQDFGSEVLTYPLVAEGKVFVVSWGENPTPTLRAFDEQTGRPLWAKSLATEGQLGEPAYDDGTVFLAVSGRIQQSTAVGYVEAYDATTGTRKWRSEPHDRSIFDTPLVAASGRVFMHGSSTGSSLLAFRQSDGGLLWDRQFGAGAGSSPALSGTRAFVSHGVRTSAIAQASGAVSWARNGHLYGNYGRTAVVAGGRLYERDPDAWTGRISDEATGNLLDEFPLVNSGSPAPAVSPTTWVYLADNRLIARRVGSNEQLWSFDGDGALRSPPLIVGDTVYVGSTSGRLFGVSLATGEQTWSHDTGDPFRRVEFDTYAITGGLGASATSLAAPGTHKLTVYGGSGDTVAPQAPAPAPPAVTASSKPAGASPGSAPTSAPRTDIAVALSPDERAACRRYQGRAPKSPATPGSDNRDRIRGTRKSDAIAAGAGRDRVAAGDGADCVSGGRDGDRIDGGLSRDVLMGGPGDDTLVGGPGKDILLCGPGRDTAHPGPGDRTGGCERVVRVRR